jgi:hypothetical protein
MSPAIAKIYKFGIVVFLLHACWLPVLAQNPRSAPNLRQLTRDSGYIFAGRVTAIQRVTTSATVQVATVRITFQVEQGIRGVRTGEKLVIREWSGLWEQGERYRRGERVLLFLYRPSKLGLTSPVAGNWGRFKVDNMGRVDLNGLASLTVDPAQVLTGRMSVNGRDFARIMRRMAEE